MIEAVHQRMREAFPETADVATIRAVRDGVHLASDLITSSPLLNTLVGRDYTGLIRRAGVMFTLDAACQCGDLPFTAKMQRMSRGHWHHLEIASGAERAHVCRTDEATAFPEDTPVKQDQRLRNNYDLFEPLPPADILLSNIPRLFVWLTFGVDRTGNITHVCWAVPAKSESEWLAHENILRSVESRGLPPIPPSAPEPDPKSKLRFKQHIEAALEDGKDGKGRKRGKKSA